MATVGPASSDRETLKSLIEHGLKQGSVFLRSGDEFTFINDAKDETIGDETKVKLCFERRNIKPGDKIYVDDGLLAFTIESISDDFKIIKCRVCNNGYLGENKGVNLPGLIPTEYSSLRNKDVQDIKFAIENQVEFITVSCIRSSDDVMEVRKLVGNSRIKLLSKIENKEGLVNFESILRISDVDVQIVSLKQKEIISRCNLVGKPIFIANHVLETLCDQKMPLRSESSDITSAVMDGVDGFVLSGETASGLYPIDAVDWLVKICTEVESYIDYNEVFLDTLRCVEKPIGVSESIASSAVKCAREVNASCIIVITEAGGTARLVSKYRSALNVIAITMDRKTAHQLNSSFGIRPYHYDSLVDENKSILKAAMHFAVSIGVAREGDLVVITQGQVQGFAEGTTTTMQ
ncbi:pyruvate kinase, partial [Rozella allomycis CSF55]